MKKLFLLLFVAAGFAACKKNSTDVPVTPGSGSSQTRIKKAIYESSVSNYTYDNQGRVVQELSSNGSKREYEYLPGVVNEKYYEGGVLKYIYKNELNNDGMVSRVTISTSPTYEELLQYNPDKTLAKRITHDGYEQVIDYFYSSGNQDSLRFKNNGVWTLTVRKKFYTDKPDLLANEYFGELFYAKRNSNLQKSEQYYYPDGTTNGTEEYVYEFDQQGRVVKETSTHGNNISISMYSY